MPSWCLVNLVDHFDCMDHEDNVDYGFLVTLIDIDYLDHFDHFGKSPIGLYPKLKFVLGSIISSVTFLVLVKRVFFYLIWELIYMALFWAMALINFVPPSWPKIQKKMCQSVYLFLSSWGTIHNAVAPTIWFSGNCCPRVRQKERRLHFRNNFIKKIMTSNSIRINF